jgi:tetratricopeptide (TPR) repeat protein
VEGFAEYMSTAVFEEGRLSVGEPNAVRAAEVDRGGLGYEEVLRWHLRPAKDRKGNDRYPFYAQSWLLAHYMLGDDERAKRLAAYFVRIGAGEEPVAAFEAATGIAVGELPKLLRQYRRNMMALRVKSDDMPRATIQAFPLGKDADAYLLTASQLRCTTPERAQPLLAKLRTLAPDAAGASPGLRLALASAEARFGDVASAITMLDAHVAADADSAEAHYLLGRAWTRRAQALSGDEQATAYANARRHLFQAYRLRKGDAPTLYHLARALSRDGPNANALNAARNARALAPAVREYAVLEAQLDLQAGDRERAVRALGPLASDPHHADMAASMRQAIEAIRAGKGLEDLLALMNPDPRKPKE